MASVWDYVADLIRITKDNQPPISDYLKHLGHPENITGGPGSDNIPVICTAVHIANLLRVGNMVEARKQLARAESYLALPWMDREPGSRNAYSELIYEGVECFHCAAHDLGLTSVSAAAMDWLKATMVAVALGANKNVPDGNWRGPYVTLTGARCGASRVGPSGKRWDEAGIPYAPWFLEDHPLSNRLGWLLGGTAHAFVKDLHIGYVKRGWVPSMRGTYGAEIRGVAQNLVDGKWNPKAIELLNATPPPRIDFTFLRSDEGSATIAHQAINYGSTSMMYMLAAWNKVQTTWPGYNISKHWGLPHLTWLLLDNPAFRQQEIEGRNARVLVESNAQTNDDMWVVGHRQDKMSWNEMKVKMQSYPTGKVVFLPSKDKRWEVRWTTKGAILVGDDIIIEPPPPDKIDMLEILAPSQQFFAKTSEVGGRISTVRDNAGRVFTLVKGEAGMAWDWFYWDDEYIYHFLTNEPGGWDDPESFKTHIPPGVTWCKRFATLGESHVSSPQIHKWANCEQGPAISMQGARTTLHGRSYTAGELGMESNDVPASTVCYRIDWRWGPNITNLETFTYAVGWGFLDWDREGADSKPVNLSSWEPLVEPIFPCFDVPKWVDEHMRGDDPPPPPPSGNWHTIHSDSAYLKFTNSMASAALGAINSGSNHIPVSEVALPPAELTYIKRELTKITGG